MEPLSAIASLAFAKFLEKASERYSDAALDKIDELRENLWARLQGKPKAENAMKAIEAGEKAELSRLSIYLQDEMEDDAEFAALMATLAAEIKAGEQEEQGKNIQINRDESTGFQTNVDEGGKAFIAQSMTINMSSDD